jgi:transposase
MNTTLRDVEFETRTIGPLVLTTPFLWRLGLREIINRLCPMAEQADLDHGLVAELVVQCRLTAPRALYDMPGWATTYDIAALYPDVDDAKQLNDDRIGRLLDAMYPHRAMLWGEVIARAARAYAIDLSRLHADTMPIKFAGLFAEQSGDATIPRLEPGYNPQGEWVQQLKLFALAAGDGGLPVWFDALSGGAGDSPSYVPQFEAFCQHAQLATLLPLEEVLVIGDRKMPTAENQLAWLRLGVGYMGPTTMQDSHRQTLRMLLDEGHGWTDLPYVAQRETAKAKDAHTVYRGVGHTVELTAPDTGMAYPVRHLYIHSSALAQHEAQRRQAEMSAIETELQRIQGLVNKYDYKTPEIIVRRVQEKAFKKRAAKRYFDIEVRRHPESPAAPLALTYTIDQERVTRDTALDGVYLLVAGGPAAQWDDASLLQEWKGQYKVEHCFRLTNQLFLCGPVFLKNAQRIVSLILLIMVGCLVAGLIERQIRRALAERHEPIHGLMPEGRDTLKPSVTRILRAFADYSLVLIKRMDGRLLQREFARPNPVQQQILEVLELPHPEALFREPFQALHPPGG